MKKQFSHLLVLFFQFQIKLTNRKSVLRQSDKHKSTISDKLTAETLHITIEMMEPSQEFNKMQETLMNLEHVLVKLNEISDMYFNTGSDQNQRGSKTSAITFNEDGSNYTNLFDNATMLTCTADRTYQLHIFFAVMAILVIAGFIAIFIIGHHGEGIN